MIVASTPAWNEPARLLERARLSVRGTVDHHYVYEGGIAQLAFGGRWRTQAQMRDHGREWAQQTTAARATLGYHVWLLQLDADEALVHGDRLRATLERWPHPAYPLPLVQENGDATLAPFKLLRLPAEIVACSEYVRFAGDSTTWNLAGYRLPAELRPALLEGPFLLHTPGLRQGIRRAVRLSRDELAVETRPDGAVQWPLPPLTLTRRFAVKADDDGTMREYEAGDGDYACPGCGKRYDTPGICEGSSESPHEPLQVEAVADGDSAKEPTKAELEAHAAELGIELPAKATKAEIAKAIAEHEGAASEAA